jgi:hypothetical protein
MEQREGTMEDLPALELTPLRTLDLDKPPAAGHPSHIASASGVVRRGDHVYVIGDDLLHLGVFKLSKPEPGRLVRVLEGEIPTDPQERAKRKADLEALTVLPPFEAHPYGALFAIGSGSGEGRDRGAVWALAPDGSLNGEPSHVDLGPLYATLGREINSLNVEGACVIGERLWLLHRGNAEDSTNAIAELSLEAVTDSLHGDLRIDPHELDAIREYDLGELDGVQLTFSDGTPIGRELLVFTASAEGEDHICGSVVGTIDGDGHVQRLREIDRKWKVEGVHASIDTGVIDFLFVCDQDDPDEPSPLLSAAMPVDAAFEHAS